MQWKSGMALAIAALLAMMVTCACNEESESNGFLGFEGSPCKKDMPHAKLRAGEADSADASDFDATKYNGLNCVARTDSADATTIHLLNFNGACGANWAGTAAVSEAGGVAIQIDNPECLIAACGACFYDWTLTVDRIASESNLAVDVTVDTCPEEGDRIKTYSFDLPPVSEGAILCRYVDVYALMDMMYQIGGASGMHMPCDDGLTGQDYEPQMLCEEGLVCDEVATGTGLCRAPCNTDTDCPLPEILACDEGLCMLKESW